MKKIFGLFVVLVIVQTDYAQSIDELMGKSSIGYQSISVTIGGNFIVTGTFPAFVTERVDQFVTRIHTEAKEVSKGNITDPQLLFQIEEKFKNYSLRNILLKRSNGEEIKIDLEMYRLDGDLNRNPYLRNDDVLIFPPVDLERNFFSISGAVNKPGKFSYVEGDDLKTAIKLAMGINQSYQGVEIAEVSRLSYDGLNLTNTKVNINSDFKLERGDRIVIKPNETQKKDFKVYVFGEVESPGEIPITKDGTTLKQAIESAGGVTEIASLKNARLFTGTQFYTVLEKQFGIKVDPSSFNTDEDIMETYLELENQLMYRMSDITEEDTSYFFLENYIRLINQSASVNFEKIWEENSPENKYNVNDGDIIYIPKKQNSVYVFGQVKQPGKLKLIPDKNYEYYIQQAGGLGEFAADEIMVIKNFTREWISPVDNNLLIEDGDFIWIPRTPSHSFNYYVATFGNYLSIVGSVATIILLLIQFGK